MYKRTLIISLLLSVAFMFAFAIQPSADELPAESFAKYLPADTFLFAELNDIPSSLDRLKELSLYKMGHDEEIADFANEIAALINDAADKEGEQEVPLTEKIGDYLKLFGAAAKGKAFAAVPVVNIEDKDIRVILGVAVTEQTKPAMLTFINKLKNEVLEQSEGDIKFDTFNFEGYEVTSVSEEGDDENETGYFAITDKVAFLAIGKKTLTAFLAALKTPPEKSLYANPDFVKCYKQVHAKEMFWYGNMDKYMEVLEPAMNIARGQFPFMEKLMIFSEMTSAYGGGVTFDGEKVVDEIVSLFNTGDDIPKLKTIEASKKLTCKMRSAKVMPKSSMIYAAGELPMDALYEDIVEMFPTVPEQLGRIENTLMLSLKDDIIPAFGTEFAFSGSFAYMTPQLLMTIELKKPEIIERIFTGLQALPEMIEIETKTFHEYNLYVFNLPNAGGPFKSIALAVKGNWLYVGLIQSVQSALIREAADSLAANEEYQKALSYAGQMKINAMFFVDFKSIIAVGYDQVMPFLQPWLAGQENFDPTTIPSKEALMQHMMPLAIFTNYTDDASFVRSVGPIPFSLFQILVMVANIGTATQMPGDPDKEPDEPEDVF